MQQQRIHGAKVALTMRSGSIMEAEALFALRWFTFTHVSGTRRAKGKPKVTTHRRRTAAVHLPWNSTRPT